MEGENNNEFLKQLSSGTVANLIFAVGFLIYRIFSTKCKHSKCKSKTKCLECSSQEDSFNSKEDEHELKIRSEFEENLQDLLRKLNNGIRASGEAIIRSNTERRDSRLHQLVVEERIEEQV